MTNEATCTEFAYELSREMGHYSARTKFVELFVHNGAGKLTQFSVLLIAFSFDPLRRFLEKKTDHLLFRPNGAERMGRKQRGGRQGPRRLVAPPPPARSAAGRMTRLIEGR